MIAKTIVARTHPRYGRWSWLAFTPSCQPHHHVNPIIMSTTSSCQPHHHQVVGKCNSLEVCVWIHGWKHSEHFWKMRWAKCARACRESSISENWGVRSGPGFVWSSPHLCYANAGRFGATLCAMRVGNRLWHGCAQQSASDAATLLVFGSAAGGC